MNLEIKESPFQPGRPVDPNKFKGRIENITEVTRYLKQVVNGNPQHLFLTGKRGMGKSSFARYIGEIAKIKCNMISVHLYLDSKTNLDDLVKDIISKIASETEESWKDKIIGLFGDRITNVDFGGLKLEFNPTQEEISTLKRNFSDILINILNNAGYNEKNGKNGLFIVIDDINGLTEKSDFANWYKSFADTLATQYSKKAPIFIILSGLPEKKEVLFNHNESFSRIFHYTNLEILDDVEIKEFYSSMFEKEDMLISDEAMDLMVKYCSGLPTMMHEIGDAVFWADTDNKIDIDDALQGILKAGNQIGDKYLKPVVNSNIRSSKYKSIFKKIGNHTVFPDDKGFTKKDLEEILNSEETKVFNDFLRRAKELGIIELVSSKKAGTYKFVNNLYPVYFMIQDLASQNLK
ncbi:MAG: ATP-binding protein [Methanobrevibacter sp.]|jgi:hypothetical protein|nr:ATP-binding protein [Candidatus Methanoflexus mossambicus]